MKAIWLVIRANIRQKKLQNILICIVLFVSIIILATSISTLVCISVPFDKMFEQQHGAHFIMQFDTNRIDENMVYTWWSEQEEVSIVSEPLEITGMFDVYYQEEKLGNQVFFSELPEVDKKIDQLSIVESEKEVSLEDNRILLPTSYAYTYNIGVGDTISIKVKDTFYDFVVDSIVVDSYYSSNFIHPTRIWVNKNTIEKLNQVSNSSLVSISVRMNDYNQLPAIWEVFEKELGTTFYGYKLEYSTIRYSYLIMSYIICAIMVVSAFVIIAIALYILYSTITSTILAEYKSIGIFKAIGFISNNIKKVYIIQYAILVAVASIPGVIVSLFTTQFLLRMVTKAMGIFIYRSITIVGISVLVCILVLFIVIFSVRRSCNSVTRIKPAIAIKYGAPERDYKRVKKVSSNLIHRCSMPMFVSIKQLLTNMKKTITNLLIYTVTIFVLVFSLNSYSSVTKMGDNLASWGYDNSDLYIKGNNENGNHQELIDKLTHDERIKYYAHINECNEGVLSSKNTHGSESTVGMVIDGDIDEIGFINLKGRNPKIENEISLGVNTAKKYDVGIGDEIQLEFDNQKYNYKVVGIYQTVEDMGQGYRIIASDFIKDNITYLQSYYAVIIKDSNSRVNTELIQKEYSDIFKNKYAISKPIDMLGDSLNMIIFYVGYSVIGLAAFFLIVMIIIIVNSTLLGIQRELKLYGILKAIGMTPNELRKSLVIETIVLVFTASLIGIPLGMIGTPRILNLFMGAMGIINYPIVMNVSESIAVLVIVLVIASSASILVSRKISNIYCRSLIDE